MIEILSGAVIVCMMTAIGVLGFWAYGEIQAIKLQSDADRASANAKIANLSTQVLDLESTVRKRDEEINQLRVTRDEQMARFELALAAKDRIIEGLQRKVTELQSNYDRLVELREKERKGF